MILEYSQKEKRKECWIIKFITTIDTQSTLLGPRQATDWSQTSGLNGFKKTEDSGVPTSSSEAVDPLGTFTDVVPLLDCSEGYLNLCVIEIGVNRQVVTETVKWKVIVTVVFSDVSTTRDHISVYRKYFAFFFVYFIDWGNVIKLI